MATFHELRIRRRELLDDLDELEASVAELILILSESIETESDDLAIIDEAVVHIDDKGLVCLHCGVKRAYSVGGLIAVRV